MRTVQQLIDAGFTLSPAEDAIGCSELFSPKPFFYYNPKSLESINDIYSGLETAKPTEYGHRLVLAGRYSPSDVFPFNVLDEERRELLDEAYQRYWTHTNDAARAKDDFSDVLRTDEPYKF
ncbi:MULTISPECIES: hypothetical protein [unclassified Variovorax]|uniref:hypothetical protein n=1 Tax=unclassified Variovorax TaxID=663243 RepID=UPI001315F12E|nr:MULTISPECIES: hypothetical protein [unclassified Variovorax]VTU43209.1 hypothetical protein SRS16P1_00465 [Variovorax sp. SRS16]VTU43240.1 hypothetical protein E5P1_00462 [Variovorax sp. PBL-E5]VTU43379.1 hypothetical protein H6P1_00441 [Variovorax sp. PBL-H6]